MKQKTMQDGDGLSNAKLLRKLAAHLRRNRAPLCNEWVRRIREARLLTSMSKGEILSETMAVYDNYLGVLETGDGTALRAYARDLSRRIIPRGVETREVLGIVLLLRDILARALFQKYHKNVLMLNRILDAYEPAANRIANTVGSGFVEQREQIIRRQEKAIQGFRIKEEERRRISRELHDEVGHALTAINVSLACLARDGSSANKRPPAKKIAAVQALIEEAMTKVHDIAYDLRPAMLDDLGILPALRSYIKKYAEQTGLLIRFNGGAEAESLNNEQKTVLFRIAQESLTNIAKHAGATRVSVAIAPAGHYLQMLIKDNGKGFVQDHQRQAPRGKKLGLIGMQERVRMINGRLAIKSTPERGTLIRVRVPLDSGMRRLRRKPDLRPNRGLRSHIPS